MLYFYAFLTFLHYLTGVLAALRGIKYHQAKAITQTEEIFLIKLENQQQSLTRSLADSDIGNHCSEFSSIFILYLQFTLCKVSEHLLQKKRYLNISQDLFQNPF